MNRRTLLQRAAAALASWPLQPLRLEAQSSPFAGANEATLLAIAEVVLPGALDESARQAVVRRFVAWHLDYREGAEGPHGYGTTRLRTTGPPPADRYPAQFAALDRAAGEHSAPTFGAMSIDQRRAVIEAALDAPPRVAQLPGQPTGANLVADLMGFYFNSPEGFDLGYQAAIGRDACRALAGSEQPPTPLAATGGKQQPDAVNPM